jgi:hypothetical protein
VVSVLATACVAGAGAGFALGGDPKPDPKPLWQQFPLGPTLTVPAVRRASRPFRPPLPAASVATDTTRSPLLLLVAAVAAALLAAASVPQRVLPPRRATAVLARERPVLAGAGTFLLLVAALLVALH